MNLLEEIRTRITDIEQVERIDLEIGPVASTAAAIREPRRGVEGKFSVWFLAALAATIVLGVLFIGGVAMEWASAEFGPGTPYGTAFFSMTGLHVSHLLSGLVVLVLVYRLGRHGSFSADDHWGVTAAVRYWTFVDAMWLLVAFPTLYLL